MYADFVPFFASVEDGQAVIAAPAGEGRTSLVSRDDLGDAAAVRPPDWEIEGWGPATWRSPPVNWRRSATSSRR
jgi:hypothetical protein